MKSKSFGPKDPHPLAETFEDSVFQAIIAAGQAFPVSEAEVIAEERRQAETPTKSDKQPPSIESIRAKMKVGKCVSTAKIIPFPTNDSIEVRSELARAARKGSEFSAEVETKLRENRRKAIDKRHANGT